MRPEILDRYLRFVDEHFFEDAGGTKIYRRKRDLALYSRAEVDRDFDTYMKSGIKP